MTVVLRKSKITRDADPHEITVTSLPNGDVLIMVGWAVEVHMEGGEENERPNKQTGCDVERGYR